MNRKPLDIIYNTYIQLGSMFLFILFFLILVSNVLPFSISIDISKKLLPLMSENHIFGTDQFGRDLFFRISAGTRTSIFIGINASILALFIGTTIGLVSGYFGFWIDSFLMRIIDIIQSFPVLLILIALSATVDPSKTMMILIIGGITWTSIARIVRGQVIQIKTKPYLCAVQAMGYSHIRIIIAHIIPNCISQIIIVFTLGISGAIMFEASLSFLGMGIPPPEPSLGRMILEGKDFLRVAPHISLLPGLMIALIVLGFNLLGEGLRDILDIKLK